MCLRHTQPWRYPRSDLRSRSPFALRVVSSSARGDVPFRALWGKSTPRSGDVPPSGFCKGLPLAYAFADFSRIRKVSAGVGRIAPQRGEWGNFPTNRSAENFSAHTVVGGDNSEPPRILNHFCCHSTAAAVLCGSTRRGLFLLPLLCGSTLDCMGGNR